MCLLPSFLIHFTTIWEFGRFSAINYGKLIEIALALAMFNSIKYRYDFW